MPSKPSTIMASDSPRWSRLSASLMGRKFASLVRSTRNP